MSADVRSKWLQAMADLACGGRSVECVKAFDSLTNDMLAAELITVDEFISAQTVIGVARKGAEQLARCHL